MNHSRWNLLPPLTDKNLFAGSSFSPLITQLLYNRGITESSQLQSFLAGDKSLSKDPFLLPDMQQAIARLYRALLSGENIAVYGDFDADGMTATALLVQGLSILGGRATPYIPHRQAEGHGLTTNALERLHRQGINLVITVDCGITNLAEVKKAKRMGLDIIITDHHNPLSEIPPAIATIDPKLAYSLYPFTELSGVGVAFKLLQALLRSIGKEEQLDRLTDLAAIGTIADISPLVAENRYLVKEGLKLMNTNPRLGIKELMIQARISNDNLDSAKISWIIAPCLNAAGRLEDGLTGYNLLMTESPEEASRLAQWLIQKNAERQRLTGTTLAQAREQVLTQGIQPLLIAADNDFSVGIIGLVAGRLTEEFYRPAIVIKTGERVSHGSCRSIPEFNMIAALSQYSNLLSQFGGHSQAAGFTLPTENLPQLQEQLSQLAATHLVGLDLRPHIDIDALVSLSELGGDTFPTTQLLAPFGQGNPVPTFLSRRVKVIDCRTMGTGGEHLRLRLKQGGTVWNSVGFRLGNHLDKIDSYLDIVYNLEADNWGGNETLRLNLLDFTPSNQTDSGNN